MTHHIDELYTMTANNKTVYCTRLYLETNGLKVTSREDRLSAKVVISKGIRFVNKDTIKVLYSNHIGTVYVYGSYHWFDTERERDEYRAQAQAEYNAMIERNRVQKAINARLDTMSKAELEAVLSMLTPNE